jgi:hypothetical protein
MTDSKTKKIVYWIATLWLSLGMASAGIVQLLRIQAEKDLMNHLGYPLYLLTILGAWKVLGVAAVLVPRLPLLKEWAYAGFFFTASGAILSHLAVGGAAMDFFGPVLLLILTVVSWYLRPESRKVASGNA